MSYKVYSSQNGRGGTVYFAEDGNELTFDWEFSMSGATIFVPTFEQWEAFCDDKDFPSARPRRTEILNHVGTEICRQQTTGGKFEVMGQFLEIIF